MSMQLEVIVQCLSANGRGDKNDNPEPLTRPGPEVIKLFNAQLS